MENNYIHWYHNHECQTFIKELLEDTNKQSKQYYSSTTQWENFSYHNDTCDSICFNYDNDSETYVQFHAFHNDEEMKREGIEERYSVFTMVNGKEDTDNYLVTNDRQEAIQYALESARDLIHYEEGMTESYFEGAKK